jgi:hypothetical protein
MSFDLHVWSVNPIPPDSFSDSEKWARETSAWVYRQRSWQIVVGNAAHVESEDVPDEARQLLPGIEWLTHLNLEGKASSESLRLMRSTAEKLARTAHGAVHDPQEDSIWLPSGVKRLVSKRSQQPFEVISLSWWFLKSPLEQRSGREKLIDLFERDVRECLPKRYGLFEPPQNVYEKTGKEHLLNFLDENLGQARNNLVVWYPHRPIVGLTFQIPSPIGPHKLGFRTGYLRIEVERQALAEPGWEAGLMRLWRNISTLVAPIYGEVRALSGYRWMGATYSSGPPHPGYPSRSWWWSGIPERLGLAVVLGDAYQRLWPVFVDNAQIEDGLAFLSMGDWRSGGDLADRIGTAPESQLERPLEAPRAMTASELLEFRMKKRRREYPAGWPFGEPFAQ